ncbi:MAG: hypothetical protein ACRDO7_04995 [Nocardioidaceae bacterium]
MLTTLALALTVAFASVGFVTGLLPTSQNGTLIPGQDNATSLTYARMHVLGLVLGAPVGVAVYLLGPVIVRARTPRTEAQHRRRIGVQWAGIVLVGGLATVPLVVMAGNPPGLIPRRFPRP